MAGISGLWEPNPNFSQNLDAFKKRCEQFAELGAPLVYSPCATAAKFTTDDYVRCVDNIREVAEVARQFKLKVAAEFVRNSTFLASLPTALRVHRRVGHPNFGILFDCYHFWSGPSKFEDMDLIQPGEIIHAHLNDTRTCRASCSISNRASFPAMAWRLWREFCASSRIGATADQSQSSCSYRNSRKLILSSWRRDQAEMRWGVQGGRRIVREYVETLLRHNPNPLATTHRRTFNDTTARRFDPPFRVYL